MTAVALDTSAAVPLVVQAHLAHTATVQAVAGRECVLTAHSLAETYSVLTRLPGDARVAPGDAVELIQANFGQTICPSLETTRALPAVLAGLGIAGGAVYDALVALPLRDTGISLLTRDARTMGTYAALSVSVELVPS